MKNLGLSFHFWWFGVCGRKQHNYWESKRWNLKLTVVMVDVHQFQFFRHFILPDRWMTFIILAHLTLPVDTGVRFFVFHERISIYNQIDASHLIWNVLNRMLFWNDKKSYVTKIWTLTVDSLQLEKWKTLEFGYLVFENKKFYLEHWRRASNMIITWWTHLCWCKFIYLKDLTQEKQNFNNLLL